MSTTYAVKAETKAGKTVLIRGGFTSEDAAGDFPIRMANYAQVWVEKEPVPQPAKKGRPGKSEAQRDAEGFLLLEKAAIAGDRCPQTHPHGPIYSGTIGRLIRAGKVRSEVYGNNFRRVTILVGEHAGSSTAAPPCGGAPWRVDGSAIIRRSDR